MRAQGRLAAGASTRTTSTSDDVYNMQAVCDPVAAFMYYHLLRESCDLPGAAWSICAPLSSYDLRGRWGLACRRQAPRRQARSSRERETSDVILMKYENECVREKVDLEKVGRELLTLPYRSRAAVVPFSHLMNMNGTWSWRDGSRVSALGRRPRHVGPAHEQHDAYEWQKNSVISVLKQGEGPGRHQSSSQTSHFSVCASTHKCCACSLLGLPEPDGRDAWLSDVRMRIALVQSSLFEYTARRTEARYVAG